MINDLRIHLAIIMYMGGCLSLMIYNAIVILHKKNRNKAMLCNTDKWIKAIHEQVAANRVILSPKHEKHLLKSLKHAEKLIAFSNALNYWKLEDSFHFYNPYMDMLVQSDAFHMLAIVYKEKKNEERAYFAYFVSQHPQVAKNTEGICIDMMNAIVSYIETSDIYCRVNVFKALCTVGNMYGIVSVLQFFSDKFNFVHHKLLADDLSKFVGDKEVLALHLWGKYRQWNDNIMLGVITFITMFSDRFKNAFLPVLQNPLASVEIRLAIIRYYKEYSFDMAQPVLIEYLSQTENYDIAAEAASALGAYPGRSTTTALISALQSDSWYVQYNAASSLVALGECWDSDALPLIQYMMEHMNNEKNMIASEVTV